MANLNKVMFIGRLTRDPETRTFGSGGKVVNFGFAVTNRRKNATTGQWEDSPMFIDVKIFGRADNMRQAELAEQSLRKGHQVFLEGRLEFEQWDDKDSPGKKRSKHVLVVENFQFLERREDGMGGGAGGGQGRTYGSAPARQSAPPRMSMGGGGYDEPQQDMDLPEGNDDKIPF